MKSNFHLLFYLRKQKNYKDGPRAIYMRITVNGKRVDMSTGRECDPTKWSSQSGRAAGTKEEIKSLNNYLDSLQTKLRNAHQVLIDSNRKITVESLYDQFTGKTEKSRYIIQLLKEHNAKIKALLGNGFEANTLKGYKTTEKHLTGYLGKVYGKSDIEINLLNHAFIEGFEFYLKSECKITGVSAAKYLKHLKKIVNHCLANNWLTVNPFINFKSTAKAKERTFLTQEELNKITSKKLSVGRLAQVRDIFVFCCYTGLSYADVQKLKRSEIGVGVDGEKWVFTNRQKTDTSTRIPLLPATLKILDQYKDHPQCENKGLVLPVLSNQKMNAYRAPVKVA